MIHHLWCQSCASHAHVGDLPGNNAARNALHSFPAHPFILLQYQVMQTNVMCQWPTGANHRAMGRSVLQSGAQLISSSLWKNSWHICDLLWPTYKSIPRFWGGKTVPNFSTCMQVHTVIATLATKDRFPLIYLFSVMSDRIEFLIIMPHRSTTYVDVAYCYRRSSMVYRSVCLSGGSRCPHGKGQFWWAKGDPL